MSYPRPYISPSTCFFHIWREQSDRYIFFACKNPFHDFHGMFHTTYICSSCGLQVCGNCTKGLNGSTITEPSAEQMEWLPTKARFRCLENVPHFRWLLEKKVEERKQRKKVVQGPRIRIANDADDWKRKDEEGEKEWRERVLEESRKMGLRPA